MQEIQANEQMWETIVSWLLLPGNWVTAQLADSDIGAYFGLVRADVDGIFAIALSVVLTPVILFLLVYPVKNFVDVVLHCYRHELKKDRIKCKTGFVVLAVFLAALAVKQYPIESWIQDGVFAVFILTWLIWFAQGRWLNK